MTGFNLRTACLAAALSSMLAVSASAASGDIARGDWGSGDCGQSRQCWLELRPQSKGTYSIRYVAADRMDANKIQCSWDGEAKLSGNRLEGTVGKMPFSARIAGGQMTVSVATACGLIPLRGVYFPIGD